MSAITVTGIIVDPNGTVPDAGGKIEFLLNAHYTRSDGKIATPAVESTAVSSMDGSFSIVLESTRDGLPSTRYYTVTLRVTFGVVSVNDVLGKIQLKSTPPSQSLSDLLQDALLAETTGQRQHDWSEAATSFIGHIAGVIDGMNRTFLLSKMPIIGLEEIYMNGILQPLGIAYTLAGDTISFVEGAQPLIGDRLDAFYLLA